MDTPTYTVTVTIGGKGQTTSSKIGSVLPLEIVTRQSGKLIITAVDAAGGDFDLSALGTMDLKATIFDSAESAITLGTGVISGAGSNIFTVSWVRDIFPAGWSQFAFDKDGVVIIYIELQETGTLDYFQWDTRLNVNDGNYTGSASVIPVSIIQYYNPTYEYDNTVAAAADPGAGKFRTNNATLASITELYINDFTQSNVDLQAYWQGLGVGSTIYIGNPNVKLEAAYFTVSGTPTDGTDFTTVPVTFVSAGTSQFTNGSQFAVTIDGMGGGAPFTDADALIKNDADNTKLIKFDASAITTGTERTITMPDANVDLTPGTGSFEEKLSGATLSAVTVATGDKVVIQDDSDSDNIKTVTAQSIADLAASGGGNFPTSTDSADKTTAYTVLVGDENTTVVAGSATAADFKITYDVSLWTTAGSLLTVANESSFIVEVEVFNTGTMTIGQGTNVFVSPGGTITMSADTSTHVRVVART